MPGLALLRGQSLAPAAFLAPGPHQVPPTAAHAVDDVAQTMQTALQAQGVYPHGSCNSFCGQLMHGKAASSLQLALSSDSASAPGASAQGQGPRQEPRRGLPPVPGLALRSQALQHCSNDKAA